MTKYEYVCRSHNPILSSFMTYHRVCNKSNTTDATCGAGTAYSSRAHEFTPVITGVGVAQSLDFSVVFCRSLFVLLSFVFLLLYFLSFYLQLLITLVGIFKFFLRKSRNECKIYSLYPSLSMSHLCH